MRFVIGREVIMKKKCFYAGIVVSMLVLAGCGKENESALALDTDVTKEVQGDSVAGNEKEEPQKIEQEVAATDDTETVQQDVTQVAAEGADFAHTQEDPVYGHFIRHNENYVDTSATSVVPMGMYYSYEIPDGYIESIKDGNLVYSKEGGDIADNHSLFVYTEGIGDVSKEDVLSKYDVNIKEVFGEDCTSGEEDHNGMSFNHYLYDVNDNGYHMYTNIYTYSDDRAVIYVEFYDSVASYDDRILQDFLNSITKAE